MKYHQVYIVNILHQISSVQFNFNYTLKTQNEYDSLAKLYFQT